MHATDILISAFSPSHGSPRPLLLKTGSGNQGSSGVTWTIVWRASMRRGNGWTQKEPLLPGCPNVLAHKLLQNSRTIPRAWSGVGVRARGRKQLTHPRAEGSSRPDLAHGSWFGHSCSISCTHINASACVRGSLDAPHPHYCQTGSRIVNKVGVTAWRKLEWKWRVLSIENRIKKIWNTLDISDASAKSRRDLIPAIGFAPSRQPPGWWWIQRDPIPTRFQPLEYSPSKVKPHWSPQKNLSMCLNLSY